MNAFIGQLRVFSGPRELGRAVFLPAAALSAATAPLLALFPGFRPAYAALYLAAVAFLFAHWLALALAFRAFLEGQRFVATVRATLAIFTFALILALALGAAKSDGRLGAPVLAGIAAPAGFVALLCGVHGAIGAFFAKDDGEAPV